ncbi:MAG: hypothetical protein ABIW38_14225 [Ferruginibacter sp.]
MTFKQKIYHHYLEKINRKIKELELVLADLKESGSNETKSTAGDKHETALAMLQIEQANVRKQMTEALLQKSLLLKINPGIAAVQILNGSLVKTNKGYFFLSMAGGKVMIEGREVTAISFQSPLGKKLAGLGVGEIAEINGNSFTIESFE